MDVISKENINKILETNDEPTARKIIMETLRKKLIENANKKHDLKFFEPENLPFIIREYLKHSESQPNNWLAFLNVFEKKINMPKHKMFKFKKDMAGPYKEFKHLFIDPLHALNLLVKRRIKYNKRQPTGGSSKGQCTCGNYGIVYGGKNSYAVDNQNNILSVVGPAHKPSEHGKPQVAGVFQLCPNMEKERECILISGPSGAGKTFLAKEYLEKYKKIYPNNKIYLIANKPFENFSIKYEKPELTETYVSNLKVNNFKNSIIVFDDVENISSNKKIQEKIVAFLEEVLNVGRSMHVSVIIISHVLMNYRFSRNMIMECNKVVMFPNSGIKFQYKNFMKKYVGLNPSKVDDILNTNSRWLCVDKSAPLSYLTNNLFKIIS